MWRLTNVDVKGSKRRGTIRAIAVMTMVDSEGEAKAARCPEKTISTERLESHSKGSASVAGSVAFAAMVICGCSGGCGSAPPEGVSTHQTATSQVEAASVELAREVEPPPIELGVEASESFGVIVRALGDARLAGKMMVELEKDGQWGEVQTEVSLRYDCHREAPQCVALVQGAELRPPPWSGELGRSQCACEGCEAAKPGRYRFVVEGCEGGRVESEEFVLGEPTR